MKKYVNGQYIEMTAEEVAAAKEIEKQMFYEEIKRPLTLEDKVRMVIESIPVMGQPKARVGMLWRPIYDAEQNVFAWEEVADPYYISTADGSYVNPYPFTDGVPITTGNWYIFDDGNVWEAIKDGNAHYNSEWFDIIGG